MTGKTSKELSSVLPLDEQTARIAAGGRHSLSFYELPTGKNKAQGGYRIGFEPDELDSIAPQAADSCIASSLSTPRPSNQHLI
jgi:hypothetical protein